MKLSPEQCATYICELIDDLGYGREIERGAQYAASGRVMKITWKDGAGFEATVQGSRPRPYRLEVIFGAKGEIDSECTCAVMNDCKHVAAAALRIAGEAYLGGYDWAYKVEDHLPSGWRRSGLAKMPNVEGDVLGPLVAAPRRHLATEGEEPRASAEALDPDAAERPWWRTYLDAPTRAEGNRILTEAFKKHAFGGHTTWFANTLTPVLSRADNPFEALERYHTEVNQVVRTFGRSKRYDDPELRAFLESDEAEAQRALYARRVHEQNFFAWLDANPNPAGTATRAVVQWVAHARGDGLPQLCFQLLVSSRKLQRAPRLLGAIKILADDLRGGRRSMPEAEKQLVYWLAGKNLQYPEGFSPEKGRVDYCPIVVDNALEWLTRWSAPGLMEWGDGQPVVFDSIPARLALRPGSEGQLAWFVLFPAQAGADPRELPVAAAGLLRDLVQRGAVPGEDDPTRTPVVVVRDGPVVRFVDTAGMPGNVLDAVCALGGVSAQRLRQSGAGARLSRKLGLSAAGAASAAIFHAVPVRPRVELRLDEDKQLTMTVTATAADGTIFNRMPDGEWAVLPRKPREEEGPALNAMPTDAEPLPETPEAGPSAETTIAIAPRDADVLPLDEWLGRFIPVTADAVATAEGGSSLSWKLTAHLFQDLVLRWGLRPRAVE